MSDRLPNVYRLDLSHEELHNIMAVYLVVSALGLKDKGKIISSLGIFMATVERLGRNGFDKLTERIGKLHDAAKEQDLE